MKEAIDTFGVVFEQEGTDDGDQKLKTADFSEVFGEVASLYYDFRQKEVGIYWYLPVDDYLVELRAMASIEESMDLSHMNDLAALEVTDFSNQRNYDLDKPLVWNEFIKSE